MFYIAFISDIIIRRGRLSDRGKITVYQQVDAKIQKIRTYPNKKINKMSGYDCYEGGIATLLDKYKCPAGYYCESSTKTACPAGTYRM